jgi:hypothetical protein
MLITMKAYQRSLTDSDAKALDSTITFLENTSVLVTNFKDQRPIESTSDIRLEENRRVLEWFKSWEKAAKNKTELMTAECREDLAWMVVVFESFTCRMVTRHSVTIPPCDINSDIIENFFCSQRGITGGNKTNPSMNNYLSNVNSIVLGQPLLSTKSNTGGRGRAAEPYMFTSPVTLRKKRRKLNYVDTST